MTQRVFTHWVHHLSRTADPDHRPQTVACDFHSTAPVLGTTAAADQASQRTVAETTDAEAACRS